MAFRRARDAVAAAVAAQRALDRYPWHHGAVVRVRMGIHTGEPTVGQDRYVGLLWVFTEPHVSASAAHGGQALLSNTTRDLAEDDLPSDVGLRDLGEHTLKDIDRPERLFQLTGEGLASDFPPPRASFQGEATALVRGREREVGGGSGRGPPRPHRRTAPRNRSGCGRRGDRAGGGGARSGGGDAWRERTRNRVRRTPSAPHRWRAAIESAIR